LAETDKTTRVKWLRSYSPGGQKHGGEIKEKRRGKKLKENEKTFHLNHDELGQRSKGKEGHMTKRSSER